MNATGVTVDALPVISGIRDALRMTNTLRDATQPPPLHGNLPRLARGT